MITRKHFCTCFVALGQILGSQRMPRAYVDRNDNQIKAQIRIKSNIMARFPGLTNTMSRRYVDHVTNELTSMYMRNPVYVYMSVSMTAYTCTSANVYKHAVCPHTLEGLRELAPSWSTRVLRMQDWTDTSDFGMLASGVIVKPLDRSDMGYILAY